MILTGTRSGLVVERRLRQRLEHGRAEAAGHDALLERHDELLAAACASDELRVERLGEARVDHSHRPAVGGERGRRPRARA